MRLTGLLAVLALVSWSQGPLASAETPATADKGGPPSLASLVEEAVAQSAELAGLQARIEAAEAMVGPARARPDPMASVGVVNIPVNAGIRLDQDAMSGLELMYSQELTRGQKRRLRGETQQREAEALRARYEITSNSIVRQVKQAYYDLQYLNEALAITEQNKQLASDILKTAESRYATGKVMQQDVFQSQVQLSRMMDSLLSLQRQRETAATQLNRLLYRPAAQPVPAFAPLERSELSDETKAGLEALKERNARLRELAVRYQQAETQVRLAQAERRPDYTVSAGYMVRQEVGMDPMTGMDMWSARLGIGLPWLNRNKYDQQVKAAEARQKAAEADLRADTNSISARIQQLLAETRVEEDRIALVETGLLPQAEGAVAASRSAYATGKLQILAVLDNQMNFYSLQLERVGLVRDREQRMAGLEYEVKGSLPTGVGMGGTEGTAMERIGGAMSAGAAEPNAGPM